MIRMQEKYVASGGDLTQAGYSALRQIETRVDGLAGGLASAQGDIAAIQDSTSFVKRQVSQTASGQTEFNFTGIPSWVQRITVTVSGLGSNGTSPYVLRVGDGAIVSTGYLGTVSAIAGATASSALVTTNLGMVVSVTAATIMHGRWTIERHSGNKWVCEGGGGFSNTAVTTHARSEVTLAGDLDRLRITTGSGADNFDAGSVNIAWE